MLGEVFGTEGFQGIISYRTSVPLKSVGLPSICDYVIWYCKDPAKKKFRDLYVPREVGEGTVYTSIELPNGDRRKMTANEKREPQTIPKDCRVFCTENLVSSGYTQTCIFDFEYRDKKYSPTSGKSWKTTLDGMKVLAEHKRIDDSGSTLRYVLFYDDYPVMKLTNLWTDMKGESDKVYAVQTASKVIQRCMLMTTDPGELVFDPTCGSGTTAYIAEQWGRRWITCDTSRVAVTLAKQRLMTAAFDYYQLAHPDEGVGSGFTYKTVSHVTLGSIANNPEIKPCMTRAGIEAAIAKYADRETLYDQPEIDRSKTRVTGPFTVEAVPAPAVRPVETVVTSQPVLLDPQSRLPGVPDPDVQTRLALTADISVARYGETARQAEWRDELLKTGIRGKGGQRVEFSRVEPLGGTRWLQADAETKGEKAERAIISFGPEHAPLEQRQVELALEEARTLKPTPRLMIFAAFQFDPEAAKDIDETNWPGIALLKVQMNADLLTDDLKKKRASNESYWLIGQPDIEVRRTEADLFQVEVLGFDYYDTVRGTIDSGGKEKIAMWLLDTDYDGRSLYPRQVFFPMAGPKDGWARLAKDLKAEINEELIEQYRETVSLPFAAGEHRRAAVKIVDDRGIESLRIVRLD